jgi:hypothetical protein
MPRRSFFVARHHDPAADRWTRALRELRDAAADYYMRFGDAPHIGAANEDEAWQRLERAEAELNAARHSRRTSRLA